jgi:hypothetical protein
MAVTATAVVWLLGPTLLSLMFDDERRSHPLTVLDFVRVTGEPRPSRLLALAKDEEGQALWHGRVDRVVRGQVNDEWQMLDLIGFDKAADLVRLVTGSAYREALADVAVTSRLVLVTDVPPEPMPTSGAAVMFLLGNGMDQSGERVDDPARGLAAINALVLRATGRTAPAWNAALEPLEDASDRGAARVVVIAFDDIAASDVWLADAETVTELALLGRHFDSLVVLRLLPSPAL